MAETVDIIGRLVLNTDEATRQVNDQTKKLQSALDKLGIPTPLAGQLDAFQQKISTIKDTLPTLRTNLASVVAESMALGKSLVALAAPAAAVAAVAAAGVAAFKAYSDFNAKVEENVTTLRELGRATGESELSLKRYLPVLKAIGADTSDLTDGFNAAADAVKDLNNPTSDIAVAFAALGKSAADFKGLNLTENFDALVRTVSQIPDPLERARIASQVFGEDLTRKLGPALNSGVDGLDKLIAKSDSAAEYLNRDSLEIAKTSDMLAKVWGDNWTGIGASFAPVANALKLTLNKILLDVGIWAQKIGVTLKDVYGNITDPSAYQEKLDQIDRTYAAEMKAIEATSSAEYEKNKASLEAARKAEAEKKKLLEAEKKAAETRKREAVALWQQELQERQRLSDTAEAMVRSARLEMLKLAGDDAAYQKALLEDELFAKEQAIQREMKLVDKKSDAYKQGEAALAAVRELYAQKNMALTREQAEETAKQLPVQKEVNAQTEERVRALMGVSDAYDKIRAFMAEGVQDTLNIKAIEEARVQINRLVADGLVLQAGLMQDLLDKSIRATEARKAAETAASAAGILGFRGLASAIKQVETLMNQGAETSDKFLAGLGLGFSGVAGAVGLVSEGLDEVLKLAVGMDLSSLLKLSGDELDAVLSQLTDFDPAQLTEGLVSAVVKASDVLGSAIPGIVAGLTNGFVNGLPDIVAGLKTNLPGIITSLTDAIPTILLEVARALPDILSAALPPLLSGFIEMLPEIVVALGTVVATAMPTIVKGVFEGVVSGLTGLFADVLDALGFDRQAATLRGESYQGQSSTSSSPRASASVNGTKTEPVDAELSDGTFTAGANGGMVRVAPNDTVVAYQKGGSNDVFGAILNNLIEANSHLRQIALNTQPNTTFTPGSSGYNSNPTRR